MKGEAYFILPNGEAVAELYVGRDGGQVQMVSAEDVLRHFEIKPNLHALVRKIGCDLEERQEKLGLTMPFTTAKAVVDLIAKEYVLVSLTVDEEAQP